MSRYECIEAFAVSDCDDDGFMLDTYSVIESGTVWQETIPFMIGGEVRLESATKWLEIPKDWVERYFREVAENV